MARIDDSKFYLLFRENPELIQDVRFVQEVRAFLEENPEMIDKIEVVRGSERQQRYFRTKQENYEKPSPSQAEVRLRVAKTSYSHFEKEKGFRNGLPIIASIVKEEAFKDYKPCPKPRYSKKIRERILTKRKPTWEETMKKLREALIGIAQVVEASE